ncbi:glycerophosphodiester phosphodiesterase domain-containing protein 5-like [Babylonia areolata]|uniref:glycerophosphodiester phosphodiesterase domain-containing protein 5-like n=1 Tax=Babylonia areolata TaxID=304850 RepID=UPI003FD153FB
MKGKMTVSHAKFQYYRHNYCLVCMTGLLGCRWHRYQQSTRDNRKRDMLWFTLFTLIFLFIIFYFYFWLISEEGYNEMEWYMFKRLKVWLPWYSILLPLTCTVFGYFLLIMVLYLCHIGHGHQLYIHIVHLVFMLLSLAGCIVMTILLNQLWNTQFHAVFLSLQMFGPFLHIGVVVIMTALMWFISHSWYKLSSRLLQLVWLVVVLGGMIGLYISPLYIHCPCITSSASMPPKPRLFAHRGAEGVAPENTVAAFREAVKFGVFGLESDVRISFDGEPFIYHDDTFLRTTNVKEVFPDRAGQDVSLFNISEIKRLNAGNWFFEQDPFRTADSVPDRDQEIYRNQSVPLLTELLDISAANDTMVMFDVRQPVEASPFHKNATQQVVQTLLSYSNLTSWKLSKLYWLVREEDQAGSPPGAVQVYAGAPPVSLLEQLNMSTVNVGFDKVDADRIQAYIRSNISSNIYVVDTPWFFSYFWCLGASSITTRRIEQLAGLQDPVWSLTDSSYLIMWVAVDILSAVIIIIIFVVQRIRLFGTSFSPESVSLTSARRARNYRSRTMKEKLLREGIIDPVDDPEGPGAGVVNHPAAYSMSSLPASASFSGVSGIHITPVTQPNQKYEVE